MSLKPLFALATLIFCLCGCSVKFAYNNVDRLVRWQMSDYLDLNAEQKDVLQHELDSLMSWHRTQHLPQYAAFSYDLADDWRDGVTESQITAVVEQMFLWGDEIQARLMPGSIEILLSLTDAQVAALPDKLERSNVEIAEDEVEVPLADIQAAWAQDFEDALERFTGRMMREQKGYISRRSLAYQPERLLWAQYRRRWQADLLALLERRDSPAEFTRGFRELVAARESYYGEEFVRVSEANIGLSREMASYLLSNLSEKQNLRFSESVRDLAEDFTELAAQGEEPQTLTEAERKTSG
jgi:hypothetical protein